MNGKKLFSLMNHIDEDLLLDAMPEAHKKALPSLRTRRHPLKAIGRFMESGVAAAVLSILVAGGVLAGVVMAGRMASKPTGDHDPSEDLNNSPGYSAGTSDVLDADGVNPSPDMEIPEEPAPVTDVLQEAPIAPPENAGLSLIIRAPQFTDQTHYLIDRHMVWESANPLNPEEEGAFGYEGDGPGALYRMEELSPELRKKPLYLPLNAESLSVEVLQDGMQLIGATVLWDSLDDTNGPCPGFSEPKKITFAEDGTLPLYPLLDAPCYLILTVKYAFTNDEMAIEGVYEYAVYIVPTEEPVIGSSMMLGIGNQIFSLEEPASCIIAGQFTRPSEDGMTAENTALSADRLDGLGVERISTYAVVPKLPYEIKNGQSADSLVYLNPWSGQSSIHIHTVHVYSRKTHELLEVRTDSTIPALPLEDYIVVLDITVTDGIYTLNGKNYNAVGDVEMQVYFLYVKPDKIDESNDQDSPPDETIEALRPIEGYPTGLVQFSPEEMEYLSTLDYRDKDVMADFAEPLYPMDAHDVLVMAELLATLPVPRIKDQLPKTHCFPGSMVVTYYFDMGGVYQYQFELICDKAATQKLLDKISPFDTPVDLGGGIRVLGGNVSGILWLEMDGYLVKTSLWGDTERFEGKDFATIFHPLTIGSLWD